MNPLGRACRAFNSSALLLTFSAIILGQAIQKGDGFYNPTALYWMTVALVLALAGASLHRLSATGTPVGTRLLVGVLAIAIGWQLSVLLTSKPGFYLTRGDIRHFHVGLWIQAAAVAAGLSRLPMLRRWWFPVLLTASLFLGTWMIRASPEPQIDVVTVHQQALSALLRGENPYRITLKNIYDREQVKLFYNPEAVFGNRLAIAYPYPPPSLLLALPGHVLLGDYRYSELILLVLGAALMGYSRRGLVPKLAAGLLLTTPRVWFVIEQGWTEPIAFFLLALTLFLLVRSAVPAAFATGVLLVTKQYLGFAGLAAVRQVFMRMPQWRASAVAGVVGAAVLVLPFFFWHENAFMRNVVWLQTLEPFRPDSLSFLSWAARAGYGQGSYLWAVGAALAAAILTLVTTRNTASGFVVALAVTMFTMFAFGSKAFCNYYFFVIGALCCAVAAWPGPGEQDVAMAPASGQTADRPRTR